MKQLYLLTLSLIVFAAAPAQITFVDSFESYNVGDYLAQSSAEWTTWSNNPGSSEDVTITDTDAFSGSQSIYFESSNANGGPQDVVLPFGNKYQTGQFTLSMMMKVEPDKGGYFNLQGEETIGQQWAASVYLVDGGTILLFDGNNEFALQSSYTPGTWFELTIDVNLNTNEWTLLLDGESQGTFANPFNAVASLDIFPYNSTDFGGNGEAAFYVDDVSYEIQPYTLPTLNGALINVESGLLLAGQSKEPTVELRNLGQETITAFDLSVTYDGNQYDQTVTGVSIPSLGFYELTMDDAITAVPDSLEMVATISNVNGQGADGDNNDDAKSIYINPVVPADGKMIVAEEATGTWCGWCPRGHVAMAELEEDFSDFVAGIAVHNNDPMVVAAYDNGIGNLISGYPSALVNRGPEVDPSAIKNNMLQDIASPPLAMVSQEATLIENTNELQVELVVEFLEDTTGPWKVAMVLTEDSVTGTTSNYAQVNYYSYETQDIPLVGAGLDWQAAPDPVPANQMVYDHVARAIVPSFGGTTGNIPSTVAAGDTFHHTFTTTVEAGWDLEQMHIITMLIGPNGRIDNGSKSHMDEADRVMTGISGPAPELGFSIAPNPASSTAFLRLSTVPQQEVYGSIIDITGKTVRTIGADRLAGKKVISLDLDGLAKGIYLVQLHSGNSKTSRKLIIQ